MILSNFTAMIHHSACTPDRVEKTNQTIRGIMIYPVDSLIALQPFEQLGQNEVEK